MKRKFSTIKQL